MRTLVVAVAVAVGVYAIGGVITTQTLMLREFHSDQDDARVASAILTTFPFDDDLAETHCGNPRCCCGRRSLQHQHTYHYGPRRVERYGTHFCIRLQQHAG